MKFLEYLIEKRTKAPRYIMYHGTSTKFLKKIMSRGLIVDPKDKKWDVDDQTNVYISSRVSLKGVYITSNLMTAVSASTNTTNKFGGNSLFVIVLFQPQSAFPDEDVIRYLIDRAVAVATGVGVSEIYDQLAVAELTYGDKDIYFKKFKETIVDAFNLVGHNSLGVDDKKLYDMLLAELIRRSAHHVKNSKWDKWKGFYYWIERHPEYKLEDLQKLVPSVQEAESNYLKALEKMTVMLKSKRKAVDDFIYSLRSPNNIGFRGRNKIVAIVEEFPWESGKPSKLKKHYGTIPNEFLEAFRQRVGRYELV